LVVHHRFFLRNAIEAFFLASLEKIER